MFGNTKIAIGFSHTPPKLTIPNHKLLIFLHMTIAECTSL